MAYFIQTERFPVYFLANPRTGSTATANAFLSLGAEALGKHHDPPSPCEEDAVIGYTVRHHCDVLVSFWYKGGGSTPFEKYVQMVLDGGHRYLGKDSFYGHWSLKPTYILRYETLDYEWQNFCLNVGLPEVKLERTPSKRPKGIKWPLLFSHRLLNQVCDRYSEEMEALGYGRK